MGNPIRQEDLELIKTLNLKNIIQYTKYIAIISGIGFTYLYFQFNHVS